MVSLSPQLDDIVINKTQMWCVDSKKKENHPKLASLSQNIRHSDAPGFQLKGFISFTKGEKIQHETGLARISPVDI